MTKNTRTLYYLVMVIYSDHLRQFTNVSSSIEQETIYISFSFCYFHCMHQYHTCRLDKLKLVRRTLA
ncbi:hypothetical protein QVD17_17406 [Tagetes erecta]|uniref:Uncharacterized protein n=1 Tax=Tagetes erecta TaxID=13708 RepID=A0AAD8P1E1_TARER|nr:hypothetical protein QVD17_17406 [Tagetes erecta]